jgi:cell division transport system permease protein
MSSKNSRNQQSKPPRNGQFWSTHRAIVGSTIRELAATPVATGVTLFVIAVALLFPALLYLISLNLMSSVGESTSNARLDVYLQVGLPVAETVEVSNYLLTIEGIASVDVVTAQEGLEEFSANADLGDVLLSLPQNPLPPSLVVTVEQAALENIDNLVNQLADIEGVDNIQFDRLWLQRVQAIAELLRSLGSLLGALVLFGLVAIIGNTVKLAMTNKQQEIRVIKLIGGTNAYVARPLLYRGALLGLGGALVASLVLGLLTLRLGGPVAQLSALYSSQFQLSGLGLTGNLLLIVIGGCTGWFAALLTIYRNISTIEP